jgi:hypothetical protein
LKLSARLTTVIAGPLYGLVDGPSLNSGRAWIGFMGDPIRKAAERAC